MEAALYAAIGPEAVRVPMWEDGARMTPDYATLPDSEAATLIASRLVAWDHAQRVSYAEIGLMVGEVYRRLLWRHYATADGAPCHSFNHFLRVCCPFAYSTAYAAMRDCDALQDVPAADLAQIPQSNMSTMKSLSTAVRRDPAVLEAAKSPGLDKFIEKAHPSQHIESRSSLRFNPTTSQKAIILRAIEIAVRTGQAASAEELIESWAVAFLQEQDGPIAIHKEMVQ